MQLSEIARVQQYLRAAFDNNRFIVQPPKKEGQPVEVYIGENFVGVLHRDTPAEHFFHAGKAVYP